MVLPEEWALNGCSYTHFNKFLSLSYELQLLTGFTRSLDLDDPLISLHEEPVPRIPSSPRVTYLSDSPRYDPTEDDLVDLELTFQQFNALFEAGIISTTEKNMSRVKRSDLSAINEFLNRSLPENESQEVPFGEHKEFSLTVDCGLKRVDSKRYRKDYFINREPVGGTTLRCSIVPRYFYIFESSREYRKRSKYYIYANRLYYRETRSICDEIFRRCHVARHRGL
jgi:hypothetical protein